jgi:hypothetical protein
MGICLCLTGWDVENPVGSPAALDRLRTKRKAKKIRSKEKKKAQMVQPTVAEGTNLTPKKSGTNNIAILVAFLVLIIVGYKVLFKM